MTDDPRTPGATPPDAYDDDRLLGHVLGLDDDPELAAAAADDEALRQRLAAMTAEIDAVRSGLEAAVPAPDDAYADPAAPRWEALREHMAAPTTPRRWPWLRLRVLAPAAALILAVAGGLTVIAHQTSQSPSELLPADSSVKELATGTNGARATDSDAGASAATQADAQDAAAARASLRRALRLARLADRAGRFQLAVVAEAQDASDASQEFLVLENVRGSAVGTLRLETTEASGEAEGLYLLLLQPKRPAAANLALAEIRAKQGSGPGVAASASPSPPDAGPAEQLRPVLVLSHDENLALAVPLPPGTDPATVRLP